MRARNLVVVLVVILVAVAIGSQSATLKEMFLPSDRDGDADQSALNPHNVRAIGYMSPAGGVILIASTPGERLEKLHVEEGQHVADGESLGRLSSFKVQNQNLTLLRKQKKAAIARQAAEKRIAEVRLRQAEIALKSAQERKDEDLVFKAQEVKLLENRYSLNKSLLDRLVSVSEEDPELVSATELEKQRLLSEQARLEWEEAELALRLAPQTAERLISAAAADRDAATALVEQLSDTTNEEVLQAQIDGAALQLELSELRAPSEGVVLTVFVDEGESVTAGPVFQIANLDNMICRAEIYETDVKRIEENQRARITSPAFFPPFDEAGLEGVVSRIGKSVTTPGLQNPNPLAPKSKHVVEVIIEIRRPDLPDNEEAFYSSASLVDLQVDVEFLDMTMELEGQEPDSQEAGGKEAESQEAESQEAESQEAESKEPTSQEGQPAGDDDSKRPSEE